MPGNLLLLCKIIALAILVTGHVRILPDPFLPFIPVVDEVGDPLFFKKSLQMVCVLSALALLCNRGVRASALILGSCLLVGVVISRAYYGNNKTFCGLALVLAGLSDFERPPYLLRWQLALVYFGAALNKLLDPDWQSGLFFEHWAGVRLKNPIFLYFAERLPELWAGKIMCWGTILAEFFASAGLLIPRMVPWALWANILFQVGLLEFTGTTFTLFFYGMQAATLAFIAWPKKDENFADSRNNFHLFQKKLLYSPTFWMIATILLALADGYPWMRDWLVRNQEISWLPAISSSFWVLWRRTLVGSVLFFFLFHFFLTRGNRNPG